VPCLSDRAVIGTRTQTNSGALLEKRCDH
jgi:hypothetical protein